jgi:phosphatidylglycerophosphate synthase
MPRPNQALCFICTWVGSDSKMKKNFQSLDFSATAPALKRIISDPILNVIPRTVSPNALTLFGGVAAGTTAVMLWLAPDLLHKDTYAGKLALVMGAILLIVYAVCDQLDGLQAKRCKNSGPAGDFLDHWVDALLANIVPAGLMFLLGVGFYQTLGMVILVALAFWANNWQTRNENERKLPFLGGLELIWVGTSILLVTAVWGHNVWATPVLGADLRDLIYWIVFVALLFAIANNIRRATDKIKDFITPLASFFCITLWLISMHDSQQLDELGRNLGFLALGLIGAKHSGDLMRQLWLGTSNNLFERNFILSGFVLIAFHILQKNDVIPSGVELGYISIMTVIFVWFLWRQSVNTFMLLSVRPAAEGNASGETLVK